MVGINIIIIWKNIRILHLLLLFTSKQPWQSPTRSCSHSRFFFSMTTRSLKSFHISMDSLWPNDSCSAIESSVRNQLRGRISIRYNAAQRSCAWVRISLTYHYHYHENDCFPITHSSLFADRLVSWQVFYHTRIINPCLTRFLKGFWYYYPIRGRSISLAVLSKFFVDTSK